MQSHRPKLISNVTWQSYNFLWFQLCRENVKVVQQTEELPPKLENEGNEASQLLERLL